MIPILELNVRCGEQKSHLLRGTMVLRRTINYCMESRFLKQRKEISGFPDPGSTFW